MSLSTGVESDAIDFHGIPITLSYEPFANDAFRRLFAGFGHGTGTNAGLRVELGTSSKPTEAGLSSEWRATFCHGLVQGYSRDGAHVLSDGMSRIEVSPELGKMSGQIFDGAHSSLSAGMQHIALSLLLRERGIFDLHAATACTSERAFVLLGDSGAGKTTFLLTLMGIGCGFLGDDRLLFRSREGKSELLAYPREFHLSPNTLQLVNQSIVELSDEPPPGGKYSVEALKIWPEQFRRSWRGSISLILPQVADQAESLVRRASAAEAFGKLLASSATVVVDAIGSRHEQLRALKTLADSADAYDLALGADLLSRPAETARRILDEIDSLAREP